MNENNRKELVNLRMKQYEVSSLNSTEKIDWGEEKQTLLDWLDNHKTYNIHVIRVPVEEKKCWAEKIFGEIMAESLQNLSVRSLNLQTQEAEETTNIQRISCIKYVLCIY